MNTPKKQKPSFDAMRLLLSIGTAFFLFVTSFLIYYFSKGYRLDLESKEIRKTGVLTIQSDPSFANLYIDGEEEGKTPKSKTLDIGTFTVSVWKSKFFPFYTFRFLSNTLLLLLKCNPKMVFA